jgi:hypothetical protein
MGLVGLTTLAGVANFATSCGKGPHDAVLEPPPPSVVVLPETVVVRTGPIGIQDRQEATYVYVEVDNRSAEPRLVSAEGDLVDAAGQTLAPLAIDEIYTPAGQKRTFALVATRPEPTAVSAKVRVRYAPVARDLPQVTIAAHKVERRGLPLACDVTLENKTDKQAVATLFCTFYDQAGKIVARPFTIIGMWPRSTRPFTFDGPPEAVTATPFLGEVVY